MIARKIIITAALVLGATSAALAQSAWTTGSASDRARAGYSSPLAGGLYDYSPGFASQPRSGLSAFARVPGPARNRDNPTAAGGGSAGYNWMVEHDY